MGTSGQQQCLVGLVDQLLDPLSSQPAVSEGEGDLLPAHLDTIRVRGVGLIDGRNRRVVPRAQVAHSDSPISATNGPVSSKSA